MSKRKREIEYSSESSSDEDEAQMYFDTRDNYITPDQVCLNVKTMLQTQEVENAIKHLISELKIKCPEKFK
jgi:hypothetical protein